MSDLQTLVALRDNLTAYLGSVHDDTERVDPMNLSEREAREIAYDLMDEYLVVLEIKELADSILKAANRAKKVMDRTIPAVFAAAEMPRGDRGGKSFFPTTQLYASIIDKENPQALYDWLRRHDYGDTVKASVNTNTLKSVIREVREANGGVIPDELLELVKVTEVSELSVRKA